jgi:hypothetical protein
VSETQVKLYYKNVNAEVIGSEHGITEEQMKRDLLIKPETMI